MAKADQATAMAISPLTKTYEVEQVIGQSLQHMTSRVCKYMTEARSAKYE